MLKDILLGAMLGQQINAGLDAGPIQKTYGAGSVPGPDFGENLTSLVLTVTPDSCPRPQPCPNAGSDPDPDSSPVLTPSSGHGPNTGLLLLRPGPALP